jgi:hypothetical protein
VPELETAFSTTMTNCPETLAVVPTADSMRSPWRWLTEPDGQVWLLPLTGIWIIGLDWLLFSEEIITFELATPILAVAGFVLGAAGAYHFQRRFAGDRRGWAALKALLAGIVVGLPFPLAGTMIGGWVLVNSGLHALITRLRMLGR